MFLFLPRPGNSSSSRSPPGTSNEIRNLSISASTDATPHPRHTPMGLISTAHESTQPISNPSMHRTMGHLFSQTARLDTRAQHHHLPKSPSAPRHRLTSSASQKAPPSPPPPSSPPLLSTRPPLLPSTLLINPIVDLSQQPLPPDEAQGVA